MYVCRRHFWKIPSIISKEEAASSVLSESDSSISVCRLQNSDSSDDCVVPVCRDSGATTATPPRKKIKRLVRYKRDWESDFPWLFIAVLKVMQLKDTIQCAARSS